MVERNLTISKDRANEIQGRFINCHFNNLFLERLFFTSGARLTIGWTCKACVAAVKRKYCSLHFDIRISWEIRTPVYFREVQLRVPLTVLQWFPQKLGVSASPLERVLWSTIWQTPMQFHLHQQWPAPPETCSIHAQPPLQSISQVIISFWLKQSNNFSTNPLYMKKTFAQQTEKPKKKYLCSKLANIMRWRIARACCALKICPPPCPPLIP